MSIEQINDHFTQGLVSLIPPFFGKPVIAAILRSYLKRVQEFEDDCFEVMGAFDINTADAARLAVLGRVVVQPNFGWNLETYRRVIRGKIAANRSHGTEDDIVNVIRLSADVTGTITVTSLAPATMIVTIYETLSADDLTAIRFLLPRARAAGVKLELVFAPVGTPGDALTWGSSLNAAIGGDLGSADGTPEGDPSFSVGTL